MTSEYQRLRYQHNPDVEAAPFKDDGQLLFLPQVNKFYALNGTSSFVWNQIREPASADEIIQLVSKNFAGVTAVEASEDVNTLLRELVSLGLVREC